MSLWILFKCFACEKNYINVFFSFSLSRHEKNKWSQRVSRGQGLHSYRRLDKRRLRYVIIFIHSYHNNKPHFLMSIRSRVSCVVFLKRLILRFTFVSRWCGETSCWNKRGRHGSGTFIGAATRRLMSHKVMFVVLRESGSGLSLIRCVTVHVSASRSTLARYHVCVAWCWCVYACVHLMDGEQTESVRKRGYRGGRFHMSGVPGGPSRKS